MSTSHRIRAAVGVAASAAVFAVAGCGGSPSQSEINAGLPPGDQCPSTPANLPPCDVYPGAFSPSPVPSPDPLEGLQTRITEAALEDGNIPTGTWLVGGDVEPGTYRTGDTGGMCYWARLSGTGGTLDDIIANGIPQGPAVVTIEPSDVAFKTQGCGEWRRVES